MKKILTVAIFVLVLILLVATSFFIAKPQRTLEAMVKIFSLPSILDEVVALKKENSELKGKLVSLQSSYPLPQDSQYAYARVFSLYPFNIKNRIYINLGKSGGVSTGQPVMFSKAVLLGQVSAVYADSSEAITVFDPTYSLPVKIGKNGIDGLFSGGVAPEVGLIDKTKQISAGDQIYSASKDLPYGLLIGVVKSVGEDSAGAFLKAQISLPYALSDVIDVYVIIK
jgi:rod shape-determining protein MreC